MVGKVFSLCFFIWFFLFPAFFGCVSVPPATGGAYLYNNYETNYITFQEQGGSLSGSTDAACYVSLVCTGDTSIFTAAKKGNIKKITSVEYRYTSFFFFYSKTTVIVKGM